jgi:excisionase family DNA binding protein
MFPSKPYLSTEEVAHLLGFSVRAITEWASQWHDSGGREGIPSFKIGRSWRFDRQQILNYIDSKKRPFQPFVPAAASAETAATAGTKPPLNTAS